MTIHKAFEAMFLKNSPRYIRPVDWPHASAIGVVGGITVWCYSEKSGVRTSPGAVPLAWVYGEWEELSPEEFAELWKTTKS